MSTLLSEDEWSLFGELIDAFRDGTEELERLQEENELLRGECRYEEEPGHFVRCPENHGSNGSLYDEGERLREENERLRKQFNYSQNRLAQERDDAMNRLRRIEDAMERIAGLQPDVNGAGGLASAIALAALADQPTEEKA